MVSATKSSGVKDRHYATMLNLALPGAGQFYLGQWLLGCAFAAGSVACFVAGLVVFIVGMQRYWELASNGEILQGQQLEKMAEAVHWGQLFILLGVLILMYLLSIAALCLVPSKRPA